MRRARPYVVALLGAVAVLRGASVAAAAEPVSAVALGGNATVRTVPAPADSVAVVASSAPTNSSVAFVIANGTDRTVRIRRVAATATSVSAASVVIARTTSVVPIQLAPGAQALGSVHFRTGTLDVDASIAWRVTATGATARDAVALPTSNDVLSAPRAGRVVQLLTLDVTNPGTRAVEAPTVNVLCVDEAGQPVLLASRSLPKKRISASKAASVSVAFSELCPSYVVAAQAVSAR
jgi:hypothetical protein